MVASPPRVLVLRSSAALLLVHVAAGCDEDFVGHYGQTDIHFWERAKRLRGLTIVYHEELVLEEVAHGRPCDRVPRQQTRLCLAAARHLPNQTRDTAHNFLLHRWKKLTGCWSDVYLRFGWAVTASYGLGGKLDF